tara:strand:+ start:126 stop:758 length:633 start_codon:yes stop_codon:yes gene_type:complete
MENKKRIKDYGEVFTQKKEVDSILNLVKNETLNLESRFLEPACGDGNFLVEILSRKISILNSRFKKDKIDFERNSIIALSSLYGIDILSDNIDKLNVRLLDIFVKNYQDHFGEINPDFLKSTKYILKKNLKFGDALNYKIPNSDIFIVFSEWSMVDLDFIKRRDFTFKDIMAYKPIDGPNLFSDLGDDAFIPTPIKDYPLKHYLKLYEQK